MGLSVPAIRARIGELLAADVLGDGNGWTVHSTIPGDSPLPALVVGWPNDVTYNETFRGSSTATFTVLAIVSLADSDHAQDLVDAAMSWPGIVAPLQAEQDGPVWHSLRCPRADNVRLVTVGQSTALGFDLTVNVTA